MTKHLKPKLRLEDSDEYFPYSDPSDLNEPEMRIYLLEKGRMEGISACNGGHRQEIHGTITYTVTRAGSDIKLFKVDGGAKWATAKGTTTDLNSKIASETRKMDGLTAAMEQDQSDEVKLQLGEGIAVSNARLLSLDKELATYTEIPRPSRSTRYYKV